MLEDLIKAEIPLIFVETDEPERIIAPETKKDLQGIWNYKGIQYRLGGSIESINYTKTMEDALAYLSATKKKYFLILYGEPIYEMLRDIPQYHTLVFVHSAFIYHPGAVKVTLPLPETEEYLKAFKDKTKFAKDCAKKSAGMIIKDATNCYKYSKYTKTDFLKNRNIFTKSNFFDVVATINTFEDLGGFKDFKKWFNERKHWYKIDGFPRQKGAILQGDTGVGKSLCASCLGNEAGLPLYRFDLTKIYDEYVGRSEHKIRQALKDIEKIAPAIIWIEEIGRLFSGQNIQSNIAHHQVLALLLEWMQEHNKDIFIVATANGIENIPKEIMRPGRFSKVFYIDNPNQEDREELWQIHLKKNNIEGNIENLVQEQLTGAEIQARIEDMVIERILQ